MLEAEEDVQQREGAAIEADLVLHRIYPGIVWVHEREEIVAQAGGKAGEVMSRVADRASRKVDNAGDLAVVDENVSRANVTMNDRRGELFAVSRKKPFEITSNCDGNVGRHDTISSMLGRIVRPLQATASSKVLPNATIPPSSANCNAAAVATRFQGHTA